MIAFQRCIAKGLTLILILYNSDPATIALISPEQGTQDTDGIIRFIFNPTDANTIDNCSLIYQDGIYTTSTSIQDGIPNIIEIVY